MSSDGSVFVSSPATLSDGSIWPLRSDVFAGLPDISSEDYTGETITVENYSDTEEDHGQITDEYTSEEEPVGEEELDAYDADHAEEAAVHHSFDDEAGLTEEIDEDEVKDPELHAELMNIGFATADESASLTEIIPGDAVFEEFGGAEHKHIGDTASRGATTSIMYGSPPRPLSFGEVVALAGDYFGDFYELKNVAKMPDGPKELA